VRGQSQLVRLRKDDFLRHIIIPQIIFTVHSEALCQSSLIIIIIIIIIIIVSLQSRMQEHFISVVLLLLLFTSLSTYHLHCWI